MNTQIQNQGASPSKEKDKEFTIVVNARQKTVTKKELTFDEVVELAFGPPNYETSVYTVTYQKGEDKKPKGSLVRGETVKVKDNMIFDVIRTDKS